MARAVSTKVRCSSIERVPRTVVAISDPIAVSETATIARATSTSTSVKPATPCRSSKHFGRDNFYSPRQPIDANVVADLVARQPDRSAARHAGREKVNRRAGNALIATRRQQRLEMHVIRHAHDFAGCAGRHRAHLRVDLVGY